MALHLSSPTSPRAAALLTELALRRPPTHGIVTIVLE
jgi:hypothetical protein